MSFMPEEAARKRQRTEVSLPLWLSSADKTADLHTLAWPTTAPDAYLADRNSVFIGYVYTLTSASSAVIAARLSHLARVVHPTIPADKLPPQFQNSAPSRRGSTHDMYAFRVMQLKPGRSGLGGAGDFGTAQGAEDDGEKWGGGRVMRVVREAGASDVLVVVSRWYGGEMLGPVRFEHIERVARAALRAHMDAEALARARAELQALDGAIARARGRLPAPETSNNYADLTPERARRLLVARRKTLDSVPRT